MLRLFVRMVLLIAIQLCTVLQSSRAIAGPEWTPRLSTLTGRAQLVQSVRQRHPSLLTQRLPEQQLSLDSLLSEMQATLTTLEDEAASMEIGPQPRLLVEYSKTTQSAKGPHEAITLEKVPPLVAALGASDAFGDLGHSILYYALHRESEVYWIRKGRSFDTQPDGFIFLIRTGPSTKPVPYFVAANGPWLSVSEVRAAIEGLTWSLGARAWWVPDFGSASSPAETKLAREGMTFEKSNPGMVSLPSKWDLAGGPYSRSYPSTRITNAFIVKRRSSGLHVLRVDQLAHGAAYSRPSLKKLSRFERALLAWTMTDRFSTHHVSTSYLELLQVTAAEVNSAMEFSLANPTAPIAGKIFEKLTSMDFSLEQLAQLDPATRAASIVALWGENPKLFDSQNGRRLAAASEAKLRETLRSSPERLGPFALNALETLFEMEKLPSIAGTGISEDYALLRNRLEAGDGDPQDAFMLKRLLLNAAQGLERFPRWSQAFLQDFLGIDAAHDPERLLRYARVSGNLGAWPQAFWEKLAGESGTSLKTAFLEGLLERWPLLSRSEMLLHPAVVQDLWDLVLKARPKTPYQAELLVFDHIMVRATGAEAFKQGTLDWCYRRAWYTGLSNYVAPFRDPRLPIPFALPTPVWKHVARVLREDLATQDNTGDWLVYVMKYSVIGAPLMQELPALVSAVLAHGSERAMNRRFLIKQMLYDQLEAPISAENRQVFDRALSLFPRPPKFDSCPGIFDPAK